MNTKTFIILVAVVAVLAGISYILLRPQGAEQSADRMGAAPFSDLPANDITAIEISDATAHVHLKKGESVWQVADRYDYPADFGKIADLVKKIVNLKISRSFQAPAETLDRLGLNAPDAENKPATSLGTRIRLMDNDKVLLELILGTFRESQTGQDGQFLRREQQETVFVVNSAFRFLKPAPAEWLEKEPLQIDAKRVSQVQYFDGDGTVRYTIERPSEDRPAVLVDVPKGRTPAQYRIDQVIDAIAPLKIEDIAAARGTSPAAVSASGGHFQYRLFDGRIIRLYTLGAVPNATADNPSFGLRLEVDYQAPEKPAATMEKATASKGNADTGEKEDTPAMIAEKAKTLNAKVNGWIYQVAKWQRDSFITDPEEFLEKEKPTPTRPKS